MTGRDAYVLPVDKPAGPTSHDVVAAARRALGNRRIGHTGTLDPFASGLMLLCVGQATRIAEYLTDLPKTYRARARFDGRTLTDDNTSEVIAPDAGAALSADAIAAALQAQVGDVLQLPPQFSAKKIAGERAYDIARRGEQAALSPVPVHIARIELLSVELPEAEFEVECGSGTYIRAIARDAGAALGTGGYLVELRRTRVGQFDVQDAVPLDALGDAERVTGAAVAPGAALAHLPALEISAEQERAIRFGQAIGADAPGPGPIKLVRADELIAIGMVRDGQVRPRKVMAHA